MSEIKIIELRDRNTFIPTMAIKLDATNKVERYLIENRCGYSPTHTNVIFLNLYNPRKCFNNPYDWGDRTYQVAHNYIIENWSNIYSGDVIDVEFILGESKEKKISERFTT